MGQTKHKFDHFTINPDIDSVHGMITEGIYQIRLYQTIRDQSQELSGKWQGLIAGVIAYLLPVAYAVLGAFLFTLRAWCREHRQNKSYIWPDSASRLLVAGIAGIAIGAFSELFPKEVLFSTLALAFLVGYSTELFTARLDDLIQNLGKHDAHLTKTTPRGP